MRQTTMGATIGSLSGGLIAYYLVRNRTWATVKKFAAVAAGAAGGGLIGYGIARVPAQERGHSSMGGMYPEAGGGDMLLREAAYDYGTPEQKVSRQRATSCSRPPDSLRGDLLQWTELVRSNKAAWKGGKVQSAQDAWEYFKDADLSPQENFYVLMIDNQGSPVGHVLVSRGTQTQTIVNPVDAIRPLILSGTTRFIVAHNHPSGNPTPSPEDAALTKRLNNAARDIGVTLLDHIVIGKNGYASMRDMGML
jgi:DNA repair protein RadC